jgi:hypothetical protein
MKLLDITNRYHFLSIIGILIVSGIMGYYLIKNIINAEFNEKLYADKEQFLYEWHTYDNIREVFYLNIGDRIEIDSIAAHISIPPTLRDTTMWDDYEKKELPFRQLHFSDRLNNNNYAITITKSLLPSVDLQRGVGEFILLLTIGLILALTYINGRISKKIWRPFFETIARLDDFKIGKPNEIRFHKTNIREFDDLNEIVEKMLLQIQKDYTNLKEFTENASHEIQTPLAIIKSKLDNLLQDKRLTPDQLEELGKIGESVKRLSKLKSGLSLLTKLDNNQFQEVEEVPLQSLLKAKLADFEELLALKDIHLHTEYTSDPTLRMNTELANILLNNLLSNAVKHNRPKGTLHVRLTDEWLAIENTGEPLQNDPKAYFQRFKKDSSSAESSGLGLALVKRICDMYGIDIQYSETQGVHRMQLWLP